MKSWAGFFLLLLFLASQAAMAEEAPPAETLSQLVETALAKNPELKASEARWQVFRNRVKHAGTLDDPMLTLKIQNGLVRDPLNFSRDPMTQKTIGISQQLPFWGKRALKEQVAAKEAESYGWLYEERKLELARMAADAYYQIYFTDKALEIVDRNFKVLDDFITLAETRYSVGQGAQQDVFKAHLERSKMLDMRISLEQQRKSLQAILNTIAYRPADTPVGKTPDFEVQPFPYTADELKKTARESRPLLKSYRALLEKAEAGHHLAHKQFYPDFNVFFEYMQREPANGEQGYDMYSLGMTFNLPVFKEHRHEMVAEASSEHIMAAEELNNAVKDIDLGISDIMAQLERRRKLVELYKTGIIPQAEQSLESAAIAYRVNKVDFLTLLDNQMTLFKYEREYYESLAEYQMKKAQMQALVGKEL